jgi:hypothetical protein
MLKFTSQFVYKATDWLIFVQGPIRGFVYKLACEFQYERLNFDCQPQTADKKLKHELAIYLSKTCRTFKCDLQM